MGDTTAGIVLGVGLVVAGAVLLYVTVVRGRIVIEAQNQVALELDRYVGTWPDGVRDSIVGSAQKAVGDALNRALP